MTAAATPDPASSSDTTQWIDITYAVKEALEGYSPRLESEQKR